MASISDPTDKLAADNFKGSHRGGYGTPAFRMAMKVARRGGTLSAGEGKAIIDHYEGILKQIEQDVEVGNGPYFTVLALIRDTLSEGKIA